VPPPPAATSAPNPPSPLPCSAAPSFREAHQAPGWGTGGGEVDLRKEANGEAGRRGIRGRGGRWGDGGGGGEAFFFPREPGEGGEDEAKALRHCEFFFFCQRP
jgi:hypothetical protein